MLREIRSSDAASLTLRSRLSSCMVESSSTGLGREPEVLADSPPNGHRQTKPSAHLLRQQTSKGGQVYPRRCQAAQRTKTASALLPQQPPLAEDGLVRPYRSRP